MKTLQKVHLKNVSEVKVEEFKFLIFLTHSTLYYVENLRNSLKNRKFLSTMKTLQKDHLKNVSELKVEEFRILIFLTHSCSIILKTYEIHSKIENFRQH